MIKRINHVAIAVSNLDDAASTWEALLGLQMSGREHVASNKVEVGFIPVGESRIELVQPAAPDSPVAKFIEKRGPGIQHLCFEVDDIEAELARLKAAGVRLINEQPVAGAHGYRIAFVHPASTGGVLVELSQPPDPR
ncbi:MAG TPA: methylmalonyl-CoA epimerase [candidate division WOR-3 bacterium]|uniref:Methylmalonyl-CoA epimerase n=1 Tax=candidate division WOR-3 bacterium TaxID=2052148 RepID=A0A7V0T565_UNCW3|nr:methylmalonyl-CoA epimerase [candidate division WOR-3 bacterium]